MSKWSSLPKWLMNRTWAFNCGMMLNICFQSSTANNWLMNIWTTALHFYNRSINTWTLNQGPSVNSWSCLCNRQLIDEHINDLHFWSFTMNDWSKNRWTLNQGPSLNSWSCIPQFYYENNNCAHRSFPSDT